MKNDNNLLFTGNVYRVGDDIDTDGIIAARYLNITDTVLLGQHCMEDIEPEFLKKIKAGDILAAGKNFGCGSAREHAPASLKGCGISCVIAESFSRTFFRNAINIGLPIIELPQAAELNAGDMVKIDCEKGEIINLTTGDRFETLPFPEFIRNLFKVGGLLTYIVERAAQKRSLKGKVEKL